MSLNYQKTTVKTTANKSNKKHPTNNTTRPKIKQPEGEPERWGEVGVSQGNRQARLWWEHGDRGRAEGRGGELISKTNRPTFQPKQPGGTKTKTTPQQTRNPDKNHYASRCGSCLLLDAQKSQLRGYAAQNPQQTRKHRQLKLRTPMPLGVVIRLSHASCSLGPRVCNASYTTASRQHKCRSTHRLLCMLSIK